MLNRREFLKTASGAVVAGLIGRQALAAEPSARPNILMILVDDLGFGDLSCQGAPDVKTPHIDRIAAEGIRFDRFYSNCPVCSPTRAALLTGRYQDLVGVPGVIRTSPNNSWGYLSPQAILLPSLLKQAGYATALVGKWHLGLEPENAPNQRGFEHFHGFLGDMMNDYYTHRREGHNYMRLNEKEIDPPGHATDLFSEWACDYISNRPKDKPFFLFLTYNAPHDPIQPPKDWLERVKQREPNMTAKRAGLVALIEHMDDGVGRVLKALDDQGIAKDTLVIFTSDNGGSLGVGATNGPHRGGKTMVYEGGLRVPAFARWPAKIAPGTRTDRIALTMDLMPSMAEAAGATITHEIDGRSVLPDMLGQMLNWPERDLFFRMREGYRPTPGTIEAMRRGDCKLLRARTGGPWELYNLAADPLEQTNLIDKEPAKAKELIEAMEKQLARYAQVPWRKPVTP